MTAKPTLTDTLTALLRSPHRTSRKGVSPSNKELEIVQRDLRAALLAAGRPVGEQRVEPWLRRGKWQYHVIEWRELTQAALPLEENN